MRLIARAVLAASSPLAVASCLNFGEPYEGGGTGGGSLPIPTDGGERPPAESADGGALRGRGPVRGGQLAWCNLFTYACPTGRTCALYGAIDPAYTAPVCAPADPCSIVTCPFPRRCVVGAGFPPPLACQ